MCLYPKLILNKRYQKTKKNGGRVPPLPHPALRYITAACGQCTECLKQKQRAWVVRMSEELRNNEECYFLTLTISDDNIEKLKNKYTEECKDENGIAKKALRLFLENYRQKYKTSIKHWCVTELGEENGRIHLHGIFFGKNIIEGIKEKWKFGFIYIGYFVNEKTVNYIVKYMTKENELKKEFRPMVLCSSGIGKNFINREDAKINKYKGENTIEYYTLRTGQRVNLPIYYRNHIFTEKQRERLFLNKIKKGDVWVMGEKINMRDNPAEYISLLKYHQDREVLLHGKKTEAWQEKEYRKRIENQRIASLVKKNDW